MISVVGFSGLFFSFLFSIITIVSYFFKSIKLRKTIFYYSIYVSVISITISFAALITAYIYSDFANHNVFQNSHSTKPLLYKITGTWGNHEGSILLWLVIMTFYNFFFTFNKTLDKTTKELTILFQTSLYICFCLFVLLTSNPFLFNKVQVNEGLGLNPILQDPILAIHPPILYVGYVGFSLILSLALSGIILKKIDTEWLKTTKNWTLFSWSMLTGGIALGSYWAYYELGWGGWWFWDPVENVSIMPWISGLALVHSLLITQNQQVLKRWIIFLSILCFSLSIFGTFLVRSGILTSVHSFASDASRGIFILIIFLVISGFSFIVFIFQTTESNKKLNLLFINKPSALIINNIIMITACMTILLGTIYPIIIEVITNKRISVGAPYFNNTVLPILLPGFLLMSIAPTLSWQENKLPNLKIYIFFFISISILTLFFSYLNYFNLWGFIGITVSLMIIISSLYSIYRNYKKFNLNHFLNYNNALIAHIGVGLVILGITCSSVFQIEKKFSLTPNKSVQIGKYILKFEGTKIFEKDNFQELVAEFILYKKNKILSKIKPSKRYYYVSKMITTEAGIYHYWNQDFYIVLGDQIDKKWNIKIYQNPLVNFIWIGVIIMVASGIAGVRKK
jgi:cytochrome c-type biogenesis protein CcmF